MSVLDEINHKEALINIAESLVISTWNKVQANRAPHWSKLPVAVDKISFLKAIRDNHNLSLKSAKILLDIATEKSILICVINPMDETTLVVGIKGE